MKIFNIISWFKGKYKLYASRGIIQGNFQDEWHRCDRRYGEKFVIICLSSFVIHWMWFEYSFVFDCLIKWFFRVLQSQHLWGKNLFEVKRLVPPQCSSVEPGVTTINWNQHKWSSVNVLGVSPASKRALVWAGENSSASVCDTYS